MGVLEEILETLKSIDKSLKGIYEVKHSYAESQRVKENRGTNRVTSKQIRFILDLCKQRNRNIPRDLETWDRKRASDFIEELQKT